MHVYTYIYLETEIVRNKDRRKLVSLMTFTTAVFEAWRMDHKAGHEQLVIEASDMAQDLKMVPTVNPQLKIVESRNGRWMVSFLCTDCE